MLKRLLYTYRVLLTGDHLMQTGKVVANIQVLDELCRLDELVARKRAGVEKTVREQFAMDLRLDAARRAS